MKRFLLFVGLILSSAAGFAQFSGSGNGTEADPYLIFNETQLSQMANFLGQEGVVFKLQKDLDLTNWISENNPSQGWMPIGVESSPFKGKFYGNNHKISGLMINRSIDYVGFFGYLNGATVKDLTLECTQSVKGNAKTALLIGKADNSTFSNIGVSGDVEGTNGVGLLIGQAVNCNFTDATVKGTLAGNNQVGGFCGDFAGSAITNLNSEATVTGTLNVGGAIGLSTGTSRVITVSATGDINAKTNVGGVVGCISSGTAGLTSCTYRGDITATSDNVGGIVGYIDCPTAFNSCFSKGKIVTQGNYVGGILGNSAGGNVSSMQSCSHFGDIKAGSYVGGLIGQIANTTAEPTLHTYEIRNADYGRYTASRTESVKTGTVKGAYLNNCTAIGNIAGVEYVGGLLGFDNASYEYTTEVKSFYLYSEVSYYNAYNFNYYIDGKFDHSSRSGDGNSEAIKYNQYTRNSYYCILTNNYCSGVIKGSDNVGGLVGYKSGGEIRYNYCYATIVGEASVGGIVGTVNDGAVSEAFNTTTIKSNVAINTTVSATKFNVGRIYGEISDHVELGTMGSQEANRALATTRVVKSGVVQEVNDDLQNGNSIGASALKLKANYVAWGWNFDDNWNIQETEGYPYKKYQVAPPVIQSDVVSQATEISGKSMNGGTVYLYYKDHEAVSTPSSGNSWSFSTEPLQSGAQVQIYADVDGMTPSYFTTTTVGFPGFGTESDPYRIYTAEDLQGASNRGYYKLMNDIDLTSWINEHSPKTGWVSIGRNSGEATYIDGDGHTISGLWINSSDNYTGLFSNFSSGQIKNLTVKVASGKIVKGGDYVGVLIGRNANGKIVNCAVNGTAEGDDYVGGVVGYVENTQLSSVSFDGKAISSAESAHVGGLAGAISGSTVDNCAVVTNIVVSGAGDFVGGLFGKSADGSIAKSMANSTINATGANNRTGGLVGSLEGTSLSTSVSEGSVSSTGAGEYSYTGGLVGYATSPISNSYSTATVDGGYYVAGLVGYTFSTIDCCYAKGNITGVTYGGGIVGELDGPSASLTKSVAATSTLSLSAQSSWASRVIGGYKNGAADPDNSNYALATMQVSLNGVAQKKTDDIVEGIAKTETELMSGSTYTALGWDFSKTWGIDDGSMYPYLLWEVNVSPVADIKLDKSALVIAVGKTEKISATVLPLSATNKRLQWKSDNVQVATVEDGAVTAVAVGTANITATSTDGSNVESVCKVTVTENKDAAIAVLQKLVDKAQGLYDNSTEGSEIGQYATGARAELLAAINSVKSQISSTMSDESLMSCTTSINSAIDSFSSKQVSAGPDTDLSSLANAIYIDKTEASPGKTFTLSIKMKNTSSVQGFQFNLYLPKGVTVAKDADGLYVAALSEARTTAKKTNYFDYEMQKDGSFMVLCNSSKGYAFDGNDGEVATIMVHAGDSLEAGDYPVIIRNAVLADTDSKPYYCSYLKSTLSISSYKPGDVDGDGKIDVTDVTAIYNYILMRNPEPFVKQAADVNGDNEINVADAARICNFILGRASFEETAAKAKAMRLGRAASSIYMQPLALAAGQEAQASVGIRNSEAFAAYQFDVKVPAGVSIKDISPSNSRSPQGDKGLFMYGAVGDGLYRVVFTSLSGNALSGSDGPVAIITFAADETAAGSRQVELHDAMLSLDGNVSRLPDAVCDIDVATSIGLAVADANAKVDVYSLSGCIVRSQVAAKGCLDGLARGIYIVNGKKIMKK